MTTSTIYFAVRKIRYSEVSFKKIQTAIRSHQKAMKIRRDSLQTELWDHAKQLLIKELTARKRAKHPIIKKLDKIDDKIKQAIV